MKNLLIIVFTFVGFLSLAQANTATVKGNDASMKTAVKNGVFEFQLPETTTEEIVEKNKAYYTSYFEVNYNANTKLAQIKMLNNTEGFRRVIVRFLASTKVRNIKFNGKDYTVAAFFEQHLK